MSTEPVPKTVAEVTLRGWELAAHALASATSERMLVAHWFVTPDDDSVHVDAELGGNERTLTFLRVVIPTLAERLQASVVAVSVPWDLGYEDREPLMVLLSLMRAQPAELSARRLLRSDPGPPWWSLGEDLVVPPRELSRLPALLAI